MQIKILGLTERTRSSRIQTLGEGEREREREKPTFFFSSLK